MRNCYNEMKLKRGHIRKEVYFYEFFLRKLFTFLEKQGSDQYLTRILVSVI